MKLVKRIIDHPMEAERMMIIPKEILSEPLMSDMSFQRLSPIGDISP
jgi:hypothetical protein